MGLSLRLGLDKGKKTRHGNSASKTAYQIGRVSRDVFEKEEMHVPLPIGLDEKIVSVPYSDLYDRPVRSIRGW